MSIDVMIVGPAEAIASAPSDETFDWLEDHFHDYEIRYGYVVLHEGDVERLGQFEDDVAVMLRRKVAQMRAEGQQPPYAVELMISA